MTKRDITKDTIKRTINAIRHTDNPERMGNKVMGMLDLAAEIGMITPSEYNRYMNEVDILVASH